MGHEPTMNPTPAQFFLLKQGLGARRAKLGIKRAGRLRRRFHKGNPLPAVAAIMGSDALKHIPIVGKIFVTPSEKRAAAVVGQVVVSANAGNLVAVKGIMHRAAPGFGIAKERAIWGTALAQVKPELVARTNKLFKTIPEADHTNPEMFAQSVAAAAGQFTAGAGAGGPTLAQQFSAYAPAITSVARATTSRSRGGRRRYPTYTDRYGRQRYSTKEPGTQMRLPAGATPSPDTAYSFMSGAVGKGSAGQTAGQLGIAAAAGAAAYFGTKAILKYFGGKAVAQEEAGVQLALAARAARYEYAMAHNLRGKPPTYGVPASVIREIGAGMKAKLAELGYNAQGVRTRSRTENFLSTYGE